MGAANFQHILQYQPGENPIISLMSLQNRSVPKTKNCFIARRNYKKIECLVIHKIADPVQNVILNFYPIDYDCVKLIKTNNCNHLIKLLVFHISLDYSQANK